MQRVMRSDTLKKKRQKESAFRGTKGQKQNNTLYINTRTFDRVLILALWA